MATKTTIKALKIIDTLELGTASEFARKMWPDSNMHVKVSNQGHGATAGKAAWLCGGSYLGRLAKMGLVRYSTALEKHILTQKGRDLISE